MAWSLVAHIGTGTSPSGGTTSAIDTTGANLIIVHIADYAADSTTVTDSKSNSWANALTASTDASSCRSQLYYCQGATVGAGHTFTATATGSSYSAINVLAFSGSATTPFDVENGHGNSSSAGSIQPGSITPGVNGELLVIGMCDLNPNASTRSIDSGFTMIDEVLYSPGTFFGGVVAYFVQTTAAAINPTWSWTGGTIEAVTRIASFKIATASGDPTSLEWQVRMGAQKGPTVRNVGY